MFHLNRIKYLILILLSLLFLPSVKAIVQPTNDFYINDYANILSEETEEYILNKSVALNNIDGTQIVVVTVPNLEGKQIEEYSIELARNFKIGDKDKNNGLLFLIALEERELRIEVGYGLEGILPDGKLGRFRDQYIIPYLKENKWDEGVKNGFDVIYKEIVTLNNLNIDYSEPIQVENNSGIDGIIIFAFFSIIFSGTLFGNLIRKQNKNKQKLYKTIYLVIWIIVMILLFIYFVILCPFMFINLLMFFSALKGHRPLIYFGGSSRGGGFSSGGGFSGGGGSFGGGGVSGKF